MPIMKYSIAEAASKFHVDGKHIQKSSPPALTLCS